jgi:hypothetical protein
MEVLKIKRNHIPVLKKILIKLRYGLALQSFRYLLIKIGIEITPYYLFQEGIDPARIKHTGDTNTNYSCELLSTKDMKILGAINYAGFTQEKLVALIDSGEKCIGIRHNSEIPAFMWVNFQELRYKATVMQLKSNEAYLWFMYTMESHRGKNLAPFLRYKSYEILKELGIDTMYSISDCFNSPAVKFKTKLNAKRLKLILFIQLFHKIRRSYTLKTYSPTI